MLRRILSSTIAPTIILAAGLVAFYWLKSQSKPPTRSSVRSRPPLVETVSFWPRDCGFEIQLGGNVVPSREVTLSAQVAGVVTAKSENLDSGRFVAGGSSLLQIDPASYQLEVDAVASELQQVQEDLRRLDVEETGNAALIEIAETKLMLATKELNRVESLFANEAVAETELLEAQRFQLEASDALQLLGNVRDLIPVRRRRLQAQLKLTQSRQAQAQLNLDRTDITAPFDGIITHDAVESGDFVQPGDVLLTIEDTATLEVDCSLRTDDLYWLWNSRSTEAATLDPESYDRAGFEVPRVNAAITYHVAGEEFHWNGMLARYAGGGIERTTRTVPCRVIVSELRRDNSDGGPPRLMRGMYVTVTLSVSPAIRLWRIPNHGMKPNGQVWTVEGNQLSIHQIQPARVLPDSVLIRADATDLKPGDRIIISQLTTVIDRMMVREAGQPEQSQ